MYVYISLYGVIMNVFDFDGTIYSGDSTIDFYFFALKRNVKLLLFLPRQCLGVILYKLGFISKTQMKEQFFIFLKGIDEIDKLIDDFWANYKVKIEKWYFDIHRDDDVVISASPEFLLAPVCRILGIRALIASKVNKSNGIFYEENCYGKEKVRYFLKKYPNSVIDKFYSDSKSDIYMARLANQAYLIKKHKMVLWKVRAKDMV